MLFGLHRSRGPELPTPEQLAAREDLVQDAIAAIEREAPDFKFIVLNVHDKHYPSSVPSNQARTSAIRNGVWCDLNEFVMVDAVGDERSYNYHEHGFAPKSETREYLADRIAEHFHAQCWREIDNIHRSFPDTVERHEEGTVGCVIYTSASLAEWRAYRSKGQLRSC